MGEIKEIFTKVIPDVNIPEENEENYVKEIEELDKNELKILEKEVEELERGGSNANLSIYFKELEKTPRLTREEEVELARRARAGDKQAEQKLVEANLKFVVLIAKKYQHYGLPLEDLIEEGNVGLLNAVKRFDPDRGIHFISYAVWWIKQAILKAISEKSRLVRLPMNRTAEISKIEKVSRQIFLEKGELPTSQEISKLTNISEKDVELLLGRGKKDYISVEAPVYESGERSFEEIYKATNSFSRDPLEIVEENNTKQLVRNLCEKVLNEREKFVVFQRYGFIDGKPKSLKEIGEVLGLTKERVRQIEKRALERLKGALESRDGEILIY